MALSYKLRVLIGGCLIVHVLLGVASSDETAGYAALGQKVVLNCEASSENVAWLFCPSNSGPPRQIAVNCAVVPSASDSYELDTANNACNLVIDAVTESHFGTYTCQDLSAADNLGSSVQLRLNENLSKGKKTIQSSTYTEIRMPQDLQVLSSDLAVDGNTDGNYLHHSCAHTNSHTEIAWWAVDLGQETRVGRVRVSNRDCCSPQFDNFYVGLTNVSPWDTPPSKATQSNVCKFFSGHPPLGGYADIVCDPGTAPGRYLYILMTAPGYLNICEVQAFYE